MVPTEDAHRRDLETATREDAASVDEDEIRVPGLTILYHPDLGRIGERTLLTALDGGHAVRLSRLEPVFAPPGGGRPAEPLADPRLSRKPFLIEPAEDGLRILRGGCRTSATVDGEPVGEELTLAADAFDRGAVLLLGGQTVLFLHRVPPLADPELPRYGLIGESPSMVRLRQGIRRVADLDVPVLLRGETGTGKELVTRALHGAGPRRDKPLVNVNMAAVPASLAAAELFGAVKGAFTGADRTRPGFFGRARGGTLFLDEIGETPLEVQPQLLRALESGEIQPVGSDESRRVDVRVVAATDADLEAAIDAGRFRAPLLHRLSGFQVVVPPLRGRREDFGRLLIHFLAEELETTGERHRMGSDPPWIPGALVARLARYDWPGNVRQLRNAIRQLVIANRGADRARLDSATQVLLEGLPSEGGAAPAAPGSSAAEARRRATDVTEDELVAALAAHRWRPHAAAHALGIPRASIYDLIAKSPNVRTAADLGRREIVACRERLGNDVNAIAAELRVSERALRRRMGELGLL